MRDVILLIPDHCLSIKFEQQSKTISHAKKVPSNQESFTHNNSYNTRGRG